MSSESHEDVWDRCGIGLKCYGNLIGTSSVDRLGIDSKCLGNVWELFGIVGLLFSGGNWFKMSWGFNLVGTLSWRNVGTMVNKVLRGVAKK